MTGKRLKPETNVQIKIFSEEGYSTRQIATRLQLAHIIMARSINNFKATRKYGYEKPIGCAKCNTKRLDDAIIFSAKKSPKKAAKGIQTALPRDVMLPSQRTICRKLFCANLKSYRPAKKPRLFRRTLLPAWYFAKKIKDGRLNNRDVLCFWMKHKYGSFMLFVGTFDGLPSREILFDTSSLL